MRKAFAKAMVEVASDPAFKPTVHSAATAKA